MESEPDRQVEELRSKVADMLALQNALSTSVLANGEPDWESYIDFEPAEGVARQLGNSTELATFLQAGSVIVTQLAPLAILHPEVAVWACRLAGSSLIDGELVGEPGLETSVSEQQRVLFGSSLLAAVQQDAIDSVRMGRWKSSDDLNAFLIAGQVLARFSPAAFCPVEDRLILLGAIEAVLERIDEGVAGGWV
jgi:hypothetical protein